MTRGNMIGIILAVICTLVTLAVFEITSHFNFLVGSRPAIVYGPKITPIIIQIAVALTLAIACFTLAKSIRPYVRLAAFALWLSVISIATHRVVDGNSDGITDVWLGIPGTTDMRYREVDEQPHECHKLLLPALCFTRGGENRVIITIVPFGRMSTGENSRLTPWRDDH